MYIGQDHGPYPAILDLDEQWQHWACAQLGLQFIQPTTVRRGGPDVVLTPPNTCRIKCITGDGNCLFRCFSYIITGSEEEHAEVRAIIVSYMVDIGHFLLSSHINNYYNSVQELYRTYKNGPGSYIRH